MLNHSFHFSDQMNNKVQLITYADRFGGKGISEIHEFLNERLEGVFGGTHLLPFYYPIDGADAGYDPIDHAKVDNKIGNWDEVKSFGTEYQITADLIVNHISAESKEFLDVQKKGRHSEYFDLFLTKEKVFGEEESIGDIKKIYRPRPGSPFTSKELSNGEKINLWTTFTSNQLDIDVSHDLGQQYLNKLLSIFCVNGVKMIRLDAAGYAIKKAGTSCFMLPETYSFIEDITQKSNNLGMEVLVEIHGHFSLQLEIAKKVDYVYDFALPPLVLHTLYTASSTALKTWFRVSPKNVITVLDTHDGIGIVDVASDGGKAGLLEAQEIDQLVDEIHARSNQTSARATGAAASNLDLYQVNCTYYEALGKDDLSYLMARAIQFFSPGIPQIYYAGFLAAENDMELLDETNVGRDINRPYFSFEQIEERLNKTVVAQLIQLIRFRNEHPSFSGEFLVQDTSDKELELQWKNEEDWSVLKINLQARTMEINYGNGDVMSKLFG